MKQMPTDMIINEYGDLIESLKSTQTMFEIHCQLLTLLSTIFTSLGNYNNKTYTTQDSAQHQK